MVTPKQDAFRDDVGADLHQRIVIRDLETGAIFARVFWACDAELIGANGPGEIFGRAIATVA